MIYKMKKSIILLTVFSMLHFMMKTNIEPIKAAEDLATIKPAPYQDTYQGRNSNVYLPNEDITYAEKQNFIKEIADYASEANEKWGIPASAIIGMAILESGYGTTRIAYYANNLFGIKVWGTNPSNAWQLKGQPDEDFEQSIPVLADYGEDRIVFDESVRRDNWYRTFDSKKEAIDYLAGNLLLNDRYVFARNNYQNRIESGWSYEDAAKQYLYDIANAGYNHLGGEYYRDRVGNLLDTWDLYQYDQRSADEDYKAERTNYFQDINGHWAQDSIERLAQLGILSGFPDGTFRPEENVTREQLIKMLVEVKGEVQVGGKMTFRDVPVSHWSNPYIEAAIKNKMIIADEYKQYFEPIKAITRQEMAIFAARALSLAPVYSNLTFQDNQAIDNHTGLVGAAVDSGIIIGFENNTFRPQESLTRAQAAIVLTRLIDYLAD